MSTKVYQRDTLFAKKLCTSWRKHEFHYRYPITWNSNISFYGKCRRTDGFMILPENRISTQREGIECY